MRTHLAKAIHNLEARFGSGNTDRWDILFASVEPEALADAVTLACARDSKFPTAARLGELTHEAARHIAYSRAAARRPTCAGRTSGCEGGWITRRNHHGALTVVACPVHNAAAAAVAEEYLDKHRQNRTDKPLPLREVRQLAADARRNLALTA